MTPTCRLLLILAVSGWIYSSCEQHELTETHVLYSHGHDDHGDHGGDHGHDEHGHEKDAHGDDKYDHGPDAKGDDDGHGDDHKGEKGKAEAPGAKEEPRNLGL